MPDDPLPVHSVAEAHLYLMATACDACGRGPLAAADIRHSRLGEAPLLHLEAACKACGHTRTFVFDISDCPSDDAEASGRPSEQTRINPTDEPSRIIDVVQWLTLFRIIVEAASKEPDRIEARSLGYEAAQCLEEALKFYDEDEDLPPLEAFFHPASRKRFEQNREQFTRARLIDMRSKLPSLSRMQRQIDDPKPPKAKKWWQWWK